MKIRNFSIIAIATLMVASVAQAQSTTGAIEQLPIRTLSHVLGHDGSGRVGREPVTDFLKPGSTSPITGNIACWGTSAYLITDCGKSLPSGAIVGTTDIQTLSGKSLTSPNISNPAITGTVTIGGVTQVFPATGLLVDTTSPQTLANKSISAPQLIFTPPSAGAARTQDSRNTDWVNATDYAGVDKTGSTESTAGLTTAISDSASLGRGLMLPCGVYLTDNVPIVANARIQSAQPGCATLKRKNSASGHYAASANSAHDFVISGIILDANGANNAGNPGTALSVTNSYHFQIGGIQTQGGNSTDGANYGVGAFISGCQDGSQGTSSSITGSTFIGASGDSTKLTGLLIQRCSNLRVEGNVSYGHSQGGIALTDPTIPVPTSPTSSNVSITKNQVYSNGIGIDVAGFTAGYGIGGAPIGSQSNFVNANIVVADNIITGNSFYGCLLQANGLTVSGNLIQGNGTNMTYGGCAVSAQRFTVSDNTVIGNSYYGLDVGGSWNGIVTGNTIRQNGKTIGQAVGLNVGATVGVTVGANDVGDNGGSSGGWEVLASALDGSGPGNYFPWLGSGLNINGLRVSITNSAMGGISITNGWNSLSIQSVMIDNAVGSAHPLDVWSAGPATLISNVGIRGTNGAWSPAIASASTVVVPDGVTNVEISGTATINSIYTTSQNALNGGLLQITPSNMGANYTAGATITCTSTGGTPGAVTAGVSANGKIYGGYVNSPGGGASAMSCAASDQTCTATPGAVTLSGGAVTAIALGSGGSGCTNPPAVIISGLTCTNNPQVYANVTSGAVTSYSIGYGGSGCTGTPSAAIANGSGFAGTAYLGVSPTDQQLILKLDGAATVKNGTGNIYLNGADFVGTGTNTLTLRSAFGNWYEVSRS